MPRRRSLKFRARVGIKPKYRWFSNIALPFALGVGATSTADLLAGIDATWNQAGTRLERIIGRIDIRANTLSLEVLGAFSFQIYDAENLVGIADPELEDARNFYQQQIHEFLVTGGEGFAKYEFDMKPRRRLAEEDTVVQVVKNSALGGTTFTHSSQLRLLLSR